MLAVSADREIRNIEKSFKGEFRKFGMSIDLEDTMEDDEYGRAVSPEELENCYNILFSVLDRLSPNFVKRTEIQAVFFRDPLIDPVSKKGVAGLGGSGKMWFTKRISNRTIIHELFHVFDDEDADWPKWERTNPRGFTYMGSIYRPEELSRRENRKNDEVEDLIDGAFVSGYAKSNQLEDRAETFTYMIMKGYHIMAEAEDNKYLMEKVNLIIDMTSRSSLLGKDFWETLMTPNIEEIEKFSEHGFACRLILDFEKKLIEPDAVIKIDGREITPLFFALELDNTKLVKLICQNGGNTNICNEKGATALEMAIANDNDIQIDSLIQKGAEIKTRAEIEYFENIGYPKVSLVDAANEIIIAPPEKITLAKEITILKALYGSPMQFAKGKERDVTQKAKKYVDGGRLYIQHTRQAFGDPHPYKPKLLKISYLVDGNSDPSGKPWEFEHSNGEIILEPAAVNQ